MIKTKKQMFLVIGIFALVMLVGGVTYAFFNYTRTGSVNTIQVGRIAFSTIQTDTIGLTNAFPITRTMAATDTTNTDDVVITITGDTSYAGGVEYLVTATEVTNTVGSGNNAKTIPISIIPTVSNGLGTSDDSYFTNRGGNSSIYKVLGNDTISNNDQLLVGYIAPDNNQTGVNGSITIRAFLDSDLVAISDTYNNGNTPTDNLGTPVSFGENKTVLTTSEWNSLQSSGVSFKVKVEANEGIWVPKPVGTAIFDIGSVVNEKFGFVKIDATGFDRVYELPDLDSLDNYYIISSSTSEEVIYAWFTTDDSTFRNYIAWYSEASTVYLNEDSSYMFSNFNSIDTLNGFNTVNLSNVRNMSHMFDGCTNVNYSLLANWDVSNVQDISYMFAEILSDSNYANKYLDASFINNWNITNVMNFEHMFMENKSYLDEVNKSIGDFTYPTFTNRPGTWDNSIVTIDSNQYYTGTYVPNE